MMNNIEKLRSVIDDVESKVEFKGQEFVLKPPSLADSMDIVKRAYAIHKADDYDNRSFDLLYVSIDALEKCMDHYSYSREDIEKLVLVSGLHGSPFIWEARKLVGIDSPVDEDEVDADLPFSSQGQQDNH